MIWSLFFVAFFDSVVSYSELLVFFSVLSASSLAASGTPGWVTATNGGVAEGFPVPSVIAPTGFSVWVLGFVGSKVGGDSGF